MKELHGLWQADMEADDRVHLIRWGQVLFLAGTPLRLTIPAYTPQSFTNRHKCRLLQERGRVKPSFFI